MLLKAKADSVRWREGRLSTTNHKARPLPAVAREAAFDHKPQSQTPSGGLGSRFLRHALNRASSSSGVRLGVGIIEHVIVEQCYSPELSVAFAGMESLVAGGADLFMASWLIATMRLLRRVQVPRNAAPVGWDGESALGSTRSTSTQRHALGLQGAEEGVGHVARSGGDFYAAFLEGGDLGGARTS